MDAPSAMIHDDHDIHEDFLLIDAHEVEADCLLDFDMEEEISNAPDHVQESPWHEDLPAVIQEADDVESDCLGCEPDMESEAVDTRYATAFVLSTILLTQG